MRLDLKRRIKVNAKLLRRKTRKMLKKIEIEPIIGELKGTWTQRNDELERDLDRKHG